MGYIYNSDNAASYCQRAACDAGGVDKDTCCKEDDTCATGNADGSPITTSECAAGYIAKADLTGDCGGVCDVPAAGAAKDICCEEDDTCATGNADGSPITSSECAAGYIAKADLTGDCGGVCDVTAAGAAKDICCE